VTSAARVEHDWPEVSWAVGVAAFAAALLVAPVVGGVVDGPRPVAAAIALAAMSLTLGRVCAPGLHLPATAPRLLVEVIVGYLGLSAVHLGATALLNLTAGEALVVDIGITAVAAWRGLTRPATPVTASAGGHARRSAALEVTVLLACAGLATFWARETVRAVPDAMAHGIFPAWQDYFLHGAEVSYLRDYPAYEGRSQYLTAIPQPLYHRGSFALAAAFSAIGDISSLATATAYWLPTGLLLTVGATFVWGAVMGGLPGGVGAVTAVFLVPDASHYGLENHFLSFHWLMQMASGSGYALALVAVALTVLVSSPAVRSTSAVVTAAVLVGAAALFRVHVALLATAMLGWYVVLTWRPRVTRRGVVALLATALIGAATLWWIESVDLAPHFLTGRSHPVDFFLSVHTQANDLPSPFRAWRDAHSDVMNVAGGFVLLLVAGLGGWLGVVAPLLATGVARRMGHSVAAVPAALLAASLTVILVVPTPAHGDVTDFGHRSFVLVYLVIAGLSGAGLARLAAEWSLRATASRGVAMVALGVVGAVGLWVPWHDGARIQQWWVPQYATLPVPPDAFPAAAYVRAHAAPGDEILAASADPYAMFVALTERRAYLSRPALFRQLGPESAQAAEARGLAHAALGPGPTFEALRQFGRTEGVGWYIADVAETHRWPEATVTQCAWCGDTLRVYDLR